MLRQFIKKAMLASVAFALIGAPVGLGFTLDGKEEEGIIEAKKRFRFTHGGVTAPHFFEALPEGGLAWQKQGVNRQPGGLLYGSEGSPWGTSSSLKPKKFI